MASRINPVPLMSLIVCVFFTLIFTVLVILKSNDLRRIQEGDPERKSAPSIESLRTEVRSKLQSIREAEQAIALRKQELYRLDLQGNVHRLYYSDGQLLGGVATPGSESAEIRGQTVALKDSSWKLTSELMALDVKYMEGLRAEYESDERQAFPSLDDAIRRRQDELKKVLEKIADQDRSYQADKERLDMQLETLRAEREKVEKQARDDDGTRRTRINRLEDRIRELLELDLRWMIDRDEAGTVIGKAGLDPDGAVLQVDTRAGKVIIDRGARDGIFPGLLFEVFNYERGAYSEKATVEVIDIEQGIATCRVLTQVDWKRNPIGRGDHIGNPVFDARKPKVFVVAGEFDRYNREDLEDFIRRTGAIVWPKLGPGVDYLVAGKRSEPEQAEARQYQILAMREQDLLQYVQTTFAPKKK